MKDFAVHCLLFAFISVVIVVLSVYFTEPDDRAAMRVFPRRFLAFTGGCVLVALILIVIQNTVASVK